MNINIYNSLILAGIIQGFIFIIVVSLSKKYNHEIIRYLMALVLCITLENLQFLLVDIKVINYDILYNYLYFPYTSIAPVFLLFYGQSLLQLNKNKHIYKWIFLPAILLFIYYTIIKIIMFFDLNEGIFYAVFWYVESMEEVFAILLSLIVVSYLLYHSIKFENKKRSSKKVIAQIGWFKLILISFLVITLVWSFISYVIIIYDKDNLSYYYPLEIITSFMIYWLGHIGVYKYGIDEERKKIRSYKNRIDPNYTSIHKENSHIKNLEALLMQQQLYLNPKLSLEDVAKKLGLSKSYLSRIVNRELQVNFTDYLNTFRVERAKEFLKNSKFLNYTLIAIGLEAGFNSKSTFNKVFKKMTGLTPSEYKKSQ